MYAEFQAAAGTDDELLPTVEPEPLDAWDVVAHYVLDGIPVLLVVGRGPETAFGQAVDWGEWLYRSERISREEYDDLVSRLTPPETWRRD